MKKSRKKLLPSEMSSALVSYFLGASGASLVSTPNLSEMIPGFVYLRVNDTQSVILSEEVWEDLKSKNRKAEVNKKIS